MGYPGCIIEGCTPSTTKRHRLPHPVKVKEFAHWIQLIGYSKKFENMTNEEIYRKVFICEKHFCKEDILFNGRLRRGAYPQLCLPEPIPSPENEEIIPLDNPIKVEISNDKEAEISDQNVDIQETDTIKAEISEYISYNQEKPEPHFDHTYAVSLHGTSNDSGEPFENDFDQAFATNIRYRKLGKKRRPLEVTFLFYPEFITPKRKTNNTDVASDSNVNKKETEDTTKEAVRFTLRRMLELAKEQEATHRLLRAWMADV